MSKLVVLIVGIVTFVWATVSAFSIFSELTFLVNGWTWSVDHGPIFIKNIALAVGKKVHEIVGGYREFVRGLVKMLHLPPLPSLVYDMAGILAFSIGRGYRLGTRGLKQDRLFLDVQKNAVERNKERELARQMLLALALGRSSGLKASPLLRAAERIQSYVIRKSRVFSLDPPSPHWFYKLANALGLTAVYGGVVLAILGLLFGIDYVYRHFS